MANSAVQTGFHWADYLVFSTVLVISAAIGLFAAYRHRRATAEELLTGNRKLPLFPVAMSITASFLSAITVLGTPVEAYVNGSEYLLSIFGLFMAALANAFVFMPVIYRLKVTSAYEYLELRFNRAIRICGSLTFILLMLLYMAIVMYTPALALSQVTGVSLEISILASGLICTLYTALGGIKAVVWTDTFQTLVILAGFLAMIIRGTVKVGGWGSVMDKVFEGQRFTWQIDWDPDPFVRHTFWTLVVGGAFLSLNVYVGNQAMIQRYISTRTLTKAKLSILLHLPMTILFLALSIWTGLVIYAYYFGCDPWSSGLISKPDQLVPYFVMDILGDLPGLPGLFVASVYSASLSTVSSGVNSLAAVMLEDFFRPWLKARGKGKESERLKSAVTVVSALVFGLLTIGLAYLAGQVSQTVLQIALSIFGMVGGPLMGLMILGMLFPCVNTWGAGSALLCSLVVSLWTGIGAILNPPLRSSTPSLPPLSTALCSLSGADPANTSSSALPVTMMTSTMMTSEMTSVLFGNLTTSFVSYPAEPEKGSLYHWYRLSYQYYSLLSSLVSISVALVVSALTGFNKNRHVDPRTYIQLPGCCGYFRNTKTDQPEKEQEKEEEEEEENEKGKTLPIFSVTTTADGTIDVRL